MDDRELIAQELRDMVSSVREARRKLEGRPPPPRPKTAPVMDRKRKRKAAKAARKKNR